jgi:thiamine biosynthesis lipoprotein
LEDSVKQKLFVKFAALALFCVLLWSCTPRPAALIGLMGNTMGTTYSVKFVADTEVPVSPEAMQTQIDALLVNINQLMSTYIESSELSLLNKAPANVPFVLSSQTSEVLTEAIRLYTLSDGALDVTVGPLVNLWGFGPNAKPETIPSQEELIQLRDYVGIDKFNFNFNTVTKSHDKVYIDLSTVAKGYAVDKIAELLISNGLTNYLVEIGGEMRVSGHKPNQENWHIAIEKPITGQRAIQSIIHIGDKALASSGDYRNYFEQDGIRYSHLINPNTGYPIQHNLVSVTVIADKSMIADGLATALIILGAEKGMALAEENQIAALFITKEGDTFVEYPSTEYKQQVVTLN